jgi:ribonuclease D
MEEWRLATTEDVAAAAALARERGRLGIDTEFMSEGRYRALLCLVQVAVDDPSGQPDDAGAAQSGDGGGRARGKPAGSRIVLIDAFDEVDVRPIAELVADPEIEVVLHAGRQDVAILRRAWQTDVTNVFDTQIVAGFAGASAQSGYANLLGQILGRRVGKSASYTRWDARPLTAEQLSYAAEDVAHLLELADELEARLRKSGRFEWAREECRRLESATDERDPETAWERVPRIGQLDPRSRAVARELAAWRERTAASEDRPVGSVLADPTLVELAKRQPSSLGALEHIRGIHPSGIRRRGQAILDAITAGREAPPIPREPSRERFDPADAPLIALAEALLRARAAEAGLAYELLASRAELELIVGAVRRAEPEPEVRTLEGWRAELVGDSLRALLSGRATLAVGANRRLTLTPIQVRASPTSPGPG